MKYIGIFAVLLMILLQGCQPRGPSVTFGEVVDKQEVTPEWAWRHANAALAAHEQEKDDE
jgi:hypothetical protein